MFAELRAISVVSAIVICTAMLLSCGSDLNGGDDRANQAEEQPALAGHQAPEVTDVESIDRAIRANSEVEAVLDEAQFTIEGHRLAYVENELWGVSATLRLDEATSLDGPWITVDDEALAETDEVTAASYSTRTDVYEINTELILVTIQPESGKILTLVPVEEPPSPLPAGPSGRP